MTMSSCPPASLPLFLYLALSLCLVASADAWSIDDIRGSSSKPASQATRLLPTNRSSLTTAFPRPPAVPLWSGEEGELKDDADRLETNLRLAEAETEATNLPRNARRRRAGPLRSWARAAGSFGNGLRTSAKHLCADDISGSAAHGSVLRGGMAVQRRHEVKRGGTKECDARGEPTAGSARHGGAPAFGGLAFGMFVERSKGKDATPESPELAVLRSENDASVNAVMAVIDSDGWDHVTEKHGITVVKKFLPPPALADSAGGKDGVVDADAAAKFACVKAYGTLDADAAKVYKLFLDNERVHEYNDNCREVRDLERLSPDTKVTWAASPRYGPFSPRDFVTIVHYRTLEDGTMLVVNRPVEHKDAKRSEKYVRAEILIATNIMRPNPLDPTKTDFVSVTHINPGGIVDSRIGSRIANALCAKAPVKLLKSLERVANSPPIPAGSLKSLHETTSVRLLD